jgi:hypothetical protein
VLTILKAGLNMAFLDDKCASNKAWKACAPFADVNQPRLRFFDREEITRLLNAAGRTDSDVDLQAVARTVPAHMVAGWHRRGPSPRDERMEIRQAPRQKN